MGVLVNLFPLQLKKNLSESLKKPNILYYIYKFGFI